MGDQCCATNETLVAQKLGSYNSKSESTSSLWRGGIVDGFAAIAAPTVG